MNIIKDHGTKILGILITLLGVIQGMAPEQLQSLFGTASGFVLTIVGGLLTIARGFQNTAAQTTTVTVTKTTPPPTSSDKS